MFAFNVNIRVRHVKTCQLIVNRAYKDIFIMTHAYSAVLQDFMRIILIWLVSNVNRNVNNVMAQKNTASHVKMDIIIIKMDAINNV